MRCGRCCGLMTEERQGDGNETFLQFRCINCGCCVDYWWAKNRINHRAGKTAPQRYAHFQRKVWRFPNRGLNEQEE